MELTELLDVFAFPALGSRQCSYYVRGPPSVFAKQAGNTCIGFPRSVRVNLQNDAGSTESMSFECASH